MQNALSSVVFYGLLSITVQASDVPVSPANADKVDAAQTTIANEANKDGVQAEGAPTAGSNEGLETNQRRVEPIETPASQGIPAQPAAVSSAVMKPESSVRDDLVVDDDIKNSIVKIYTVSNIPKYRVPWNASTASATGSGSIIEGNRILTNAHVVADSTFIQVKRFGETIRYEAKVVNVSHAADLAILEVSDPDFFEGSVSLKFGELPQIQQEVLVYGFPMGGGGMSVTKGVVSRVEYQRYAHSGELLLAVQVDAAINSGNSGGPVISNGKQIGVVMQKRTRADNIGYMVPMPVINHFLKDIEDGQLDGFPGIGIHTQPIENRAIKKKYQMPDDKTGVLVYRVDFNSPANGLIMMNDVITGIEGHDITDSEEVEYRPNEYLSYWYFIDERQIGDEVTFNILREGIERQVTIKLAGSYKEYRLVPYEQYDRQPTYFIFGGLVFMPMTTNYLVESGWNSELAYKPSTEEKRGVVVLTQVLADSVNRGYHELADIVIEKVNGQIFSDINEFYHLVMTANTPYITLMDDIGYQIIIDRQLATQRSPEILQRYGVPAAHSDDLTIETQTNGTL